MLAPLSWLKEYVDIDVTPKELEEKLFSAGFEVEEVKELGADISGVVVGLVEECRLIPDTHISVCKVNCGDRVYSKFVAARITLPWARNFPPLWWEQRFTLPPRTT